MTENPPPVRLPTPRWRLLFAYLAWTWIATWLFENYLFPQAMGWDKKVSMFSWRYLALNGLIYMVVGAIYAFGLARRKRERLWTVLVAVGVGFAFELWLMARETTGDRSSPATDTLGLLMVGTGWALTEIWLPWVATRRTDQLLAPLRATHAALGNGLGVLLATAFWVWPTYDALVIGPDPEHDLPLPVRVNMCDLEPERAEYWQTHGLPFFEKPGGHGAVAFEAPACEDAVIRGVELATVPGRDGVERLNIRVEYGAPEAEDMKTGWQAYEVVKAQKRHR